MFTHAQIWRGIDLLAAHAQTSPSGLARRAGLDATTFNPSKRVSADGSKARWPSTESLTKALSAANLDFESFAALVLDRDSRSALPRLEMPDTAGGQAFSPGGVPRGPGWTLKPFPGVVLSDAYSLTITDTALEPAYRVGDTLVVSPSADIGDGNRVVVERSDGTISAWVFRNRSAQEIELSPINTRNETRRVSLADIRWMSRILWVSQ